MGIALKRIFNGGIQRRPFTAFKRYEVTNVNYSSSFEISVLRGISDNDVLMEVSTSVDGEIAVDTFLTSSGGATRELNSIPQKVIWNTIDSTFFRGRRDIRLYDTASVVSIPQNKFGDAIKPRSIHGFDNSHNSEIGFSDKKISHEYGLILANELTSSTYIKGSDILLELGLDGEIQDRSGYGTFVNRVTPHKYTFVESNANIGKVVSLTDKTKPAITVNHADHFNRFNKEDDWAVSFWASIPPSQSVNPEAVGLVQKRTSWTHINDVGNIVTEIQPSIQYPFDISVYTETGSNAGKLRIMASNGDKTLNISSSDTYNDGQFHHYVVNKTGSNIVVSVDGTKTISSSYAFGGSVTNDRDIVIGKGFDLGDLTTAPRFSGSIGQVRLHSSALTDDEVSSLYDNSDSGSALQRPEIGYVFYNQGVMVISDPRPRYQNIFLGDGTWDYSSADYEFNYRSTKQVEEVSILCELKRNEFNVSTNPSLRIDHTDTDNRLKPMVTGSDFRPYITQIGLYNDGGELLAIAKLGSPLKKRRDVDVTVNVKFDID